MHGETQIGSWFNREMMFNHCTQRCAQSAVCTEVLLERFPIDRIVEMSYGIKVGETEAHRREFARL